MYPNGLDTLAVWRTSRVLLKNLWGFLHLKYWREVALLLSTGALAALLSSATANATMSDFLASWFSYETPYSSVRRQKQELDALRESYQFQAESWEYAELAVAEHVAYVTASIESLITHKMETIPEQIVPFSGATKVVSSSLFEVNHLCNIASNLDALTSAFAIDGDASPITEECINWKTAIASVKLEAFELERELGDAANQIGSASEEAIEEAIDFLCETFEVFCPVAGAEQKLY